MLKEVHIDPAYIVLIPSYNSGKFLLDVVSAALEKWMTVWVVIDGSTDGSDVLLKSVCGEHPRLRS